MALTKVTSNVVGNDYIWNEETQQWDLITK